MPRYGRVSLVNYQSDAASPKASGPWLNIDTAAGTAHTNSTTETAVASYTFGPGDLESGSVVEWECVVRATATNSTDTLTLVAYFGGTTLTTAIATLNAVDVADNDLVVFKGTITVRDADASGTYVASTLTQNPAATGAGTLEFHNTIESVDFTGSLLLEVGADWSVASASNSCQTETFNVRRAEGS